MSSHIKHALNLMLLFILAFTLTGCGSGSGSTISTEKTAKVSAKVVFATASPQTIVAGSNIMQQLGITKCSLSIVPKTSGIDVPPEIDLLAAYNASGTTSIAVSNLVSGEEYNFTISAYNSSNQLIYQGSTSQIMQSGINSLSLVVNPYAAINYSNSTLNGVWFLLPAGGETPIYFIASGNGSITDHSSYNAATPAGSYTVQSNGTYTLNLDTVNNVAFTFSGTLASATSGSVSWAGGSGTIAKVASIAACQGAWRGLLTESVGSATHQVSYTVDATGVISNFSGFTGPVTGRMYSDNGKAIAFFKTGSTTEYNQFKIWVSFSGSTVDGKFSNNSSAAVAGIAQLESVDWYWNGNTLYGQSGNGSSTVPGTDIKSVTFSSDATYLYWSMELYGTPNTALGSYAGYSVSIIKADGSAFDSRVSYMNGGWINMLAKGATIGSFGGFTQLNPTTAILGRIPISELGSGDIKSFPYVQAYVYLGQVNGIDNATAGIGDWP